MATLFYIIVEYLMFGIIVVCIGLVIEHIILGSDYQPRTRDLVATIIIWPIFIGYLIVEAYRKVAGKYVG